MQQLRNRKPFAHVYWGYNYKSANLQEQGNTHSLLAHEWAFSVRFPTECSKEINTVLKLWFGLFGLFDWFVDFEAKKLQKACQYSRSLPGNKTPSYWSFIKYAYCDAQNSTHALNVISLRGSDCLVSGVSIVQNYLPEHSVHLSLLTPRTSEVKLKTDPLHNSKWM